MLAAALPRAKDSEASMALRLEQTTVTAWVWECRTLVRRLPSAQAWDAGTAPWWGEAQAKGWAEALARA